MKNILLCVGLSLLAGWALVALDIISRPQQNSVELVVSAAPTNREEIDYRLIPVYFVPANLMLNASRPPYIDRAMGAIQSWYYSKIGKTFKFSPTITVRGKYSLNWYLAINDPVVLPVSTNVLDNILRDLTTFRETRIYVIFMEGWAGGESVGDIKRGVALLGQSVIDALYTDDESPIWEINGRRPLAHEIGHALGLPHSYNEAEHRMAYLSIMSDGGVSFPEGSFNGQEIIFLLQSPYLRP